MKLASKKGKTFADVAKPIQNLIEKLKDKPQSQAVKNSTMLLEKQLDALFAQQEAMKPQAPQAPQDMNQMIQNPQEEMMEGAQGQNPQEEQMEMMQPQMGYGGYLYKHFAGETVGNPNKTNNSFNAALDNRTSYKLPPEEPAMTDEQAQRYDYRRKQRFKEFHPSYGTTVQNRPDGYQEPIANQMGPINRPDGYVDPNQPVQNNFNPVFGQENNSSMMNAQPTYNNNIFQPAVTGPGDIVRNQSNQQELGAALNKQTQEQPTDMVTFGRKNSKINYDKPDFVAKKDAAKTETNANPYNNWAELGALGTGMAGMYKQMRNNAQVQAPTDVQSVYLGNGIAPPKVDYSNEQNQINNDAAADREAVRLGGGSFSTQAGNLGKIRAQQLEGRGKIATQQSRENSANMAAYNDRVANLGAESQKMNLAAAAENNANKVGFQQWQAAQDNAAIANATQMGTNIFNNKTMYKNQLAQAQIMANAHPESVWADAQGNKFYTTPQGQKIPLSPQTEAPVVSATNPTGVNMVPAATPAANTVAPIRKTNSKNQNIVSSDGGKTWQVDSTPSKIKTNIVNGKKVQASYAEGGSVYRKALQEQINQPTIANTNAMDVEYAKNLREGNTSFKSSITGLEYKVMPRGEKDLLAANMWKEAHGTAPTKTQVAATKKAIENKPTSSAKAKTVAEIIHTVNNPVSTGVAPVNNFNTTPPGQLPIINTNMYSEDLRKAGTAVTPQGRKTGPSMIDKFQTWQNQPSAYRPSTAAAPDYSNQNTMQYMNQNNMPTFNTPNEEPTRNQISRIMKNEPAYKPGTYKQQATPLFESVPVDNRSKYNSFNTGSVDEGNQNTMLYMDKNNMPTNFGPPKLSKNPNTKTIKMNEGLNQNNVDNTRTNLQANKSPKKQDQNIPMLNQKIGKPTIMNQGSDAYNDVRDYNKANMTSATPTKEVAAKPVNAKPVNVSKNNILSDSTLSVNKYDINSMKRDQSKIVSKATSDAINNIANGLKKPIPTSVRIEIKDILNNQLGTKFKVTEDDFTDSQKAKIIELVNKNKVIDDYSKYEDKGMNKVSDQWNDTKNVRNSLGLFNYKQKGDTTYIDGVSNYNEKQEGKVKKSYPEWYKYWTEDKNMNPKLSLFRAAGSAWGSAGTDIEGGDDTKGTKIKIKLYNPKKKKS
jgi:hypothetical protein